MPVAAVMCFGSPRIISGSSAAALGMRHGSTTASFACVSLLEITAIKVASEPVPAVVGTAKKGTAGSLHLPIPRQPAVLQLLAAPRAITLAASMEEPPPNASTESQRSW